MALPRFIFGTTTGSEPTMYYGQINYVNKLTNTFNLYDLEGLGAFGAVTGIACDRTTIIAVGGPNVFQSGSEPGQLWAVSGFERNGNLIFSAINTINDYSPTLLTNPVRGPCVATDGNGTWLIGFGYAGGEDPTIYSNLARSIDGGATWEISGVSTPLVDFNGGLVRIGSIIYIGGGRFIAGCQNSADATDSPLIFYTDDQGATWIPATTDRDDTSGVVFVVAWNGSVLLAGYGCFQEGATSPCILRSSDRGITWTSQSTPLDSEPEFVGDEILGPTVTGLAWNGQEWGAIGGSGPSVNGGLGGTMSSPNGESGTWTFYPFNESADGPPAGGTLGGSDATYPSLFYWTGPSALPGGAYSGTPRYWATSNLYGNTEITDTGWASLYGEDSDFEGGYCLCFGQGTGGSSPIRQYPRDDQLAPGGVRIAGLGHGNPSSTQGSIRQGFRGTYT